jgi:PD-(D/E)XK nuclease superfamily
MSKFYPFASYSLWQLFSPAIGKEHWHCDRKRGYLKARKELEIKELGKSNNVPQEIGHLAQRGIYEFHQNPELLSALDGVEKIAKLLELDRKLLEIQDRVISILNNYHQQPILINKKILTLNKGSEDEGFPEPVFIERGNFAFNLFLALDCILLEEDDTIHILDFKTGKSDFDRRQAYVYLLAAKYLYPNKSAIASFYNLETQVWSEFITATSGAIESVQIELALIAQKHQQQLQTYRNNPTAFDRIYPANPSSICQYCPFNSICTDAIVTKTNNFPNSIDIQSNELLCLNSSL